MTDTAPSTRQTTTPVKLTGAALIAAAILLATPLLQREEGLRTIGYYDIVHVPTYCYGGTGAKAIVGKRYLMAECNTQLATDARQHADGIARCIKVATPPSSLAAFVSFSYNVGVGGFCNTSVARDLNAGNLRGACADLSKFVFAKGKQIPDLVGRRQRERALCETGLPLTPIAGASK